MLSAFLQSMQTSTGQGGVPLAWLPNMTEIYGKKYDLNYSPIGKEMDVADPNLGVGHNCSRADTNRVTCMACNIYFEARNQPLAGQIAVGQTVMTRLFSRAYAKSPSTTTCDIVYQHAQYSWTEDGKDHHMNDATSFKNAVMAAQTALEKGPGPYDRDNMGNYTGPYTNYFALAGMTTGKAPDWWNQGTCTTTHYTPNYSSDHQFCALQATTNRPASEILVAEGLRPNSGALEDAGSAAGMR
jgi:hypothetical protein